MLVLQIAGDRMTPVDFRRKWGVINNSNAITTCMPAALVGYQAQVWCQSDVCKEMEGALGPKLQGIRCAWSGLGERRWC